MLKGIHLTLMVGPAVPVPVPRMVLDALTKVEVTHNTEGASGFELTFTLSNRSPLQTLFLVTGGSLPPIVRVVLIATVNGTPEVLMDGVMTDHQVVPGSNGNSSLVVTGADLTAVMDYDLFGFQQILNGTPFPATTPEMRVAIILRKYAALGVVPLVVPAFLTDIQNPLDYVPHQQGTDLDYIRCLAKIVGHVFYLEPGPVPLMSKAYWGPEVKIGVPQSALNINLDAHTNVESLTFHLSKEERVQPYITIQDPIFKLSIPVPIPTDVSVLNPPLGAIPPRPTKFVQVEGTSKLNWTKALMRGVAVASRSSDAVTATGTLDVARYGRLLKARRLVGVRGAGMAFDGLYYVRSVTHQIERGQYKQSFKLGRNGLVSTVPRVPA